MMRADAFYYNIDPVRTEMTGTQQFTISHVYDSDKSKSKGIIADENVSQVCSIDDSESESIIADENYTEERES